MTPSPAMPRESPAHRDYVLVHGGNMSAEAWNRFTIGDPVSTLDGLMGGLIWDPVIPALRGAGTRVVAPTLIDEHDTDLSGHIAQIVQLCTDGGLSDVVLAGHSYGGMVITGVAARIPGLVRGLVYVDAALPRSGQSLFDVIESGGRDPLSFEGLEAAAPYVQPLDFDPDAIAALPKRYLLCTESEFAPITAVARRLIRSAADEPWSYRELATWHVPMATMPDVVAEEILAV